MECVLIEIEWQFLHLEGCRIDSERMNIGVVVTDSKPYLMGIAVKQQKKHSRNIAGDGDHFFVPMIKVRLIKVSIFWIFSTMLGGHKHKRLNHH